MELMEQIKETVEFIRTKTKTEPPFTTAAILKMVRSQTRFSLIIRATPSNGPYAKFETQMGTIWVIATLSCMMSG